MLDRSPRTPFPDAPEPGKPVKLEGNDAVIALAYRGAVTAADAYRSVRAAVRADDQVVRLGNRFVARRKYREVAFLSVGNASVSGAMAVVDALGESVTQGFAAGPDPLPDEVPFRSEVVPRGWPGSASGEKATGAALELAEGLGADDLLIVILSPGALTALGLPPKGMGGGAWRELLISASEKGATAAELSLLARLTGTGGVGGRLGAAASKCDVVTLIVERGEGGGLIGGGPMRAPAVGERQAGRAVLERTGLWPTISADLRASFSGGAAPPSSSMVARPVVVAGPADALRGAADAVEEKRWLPRLVALHLAGRPRDAASEFLKRFEEVVAAEGTVPSDRRGVVGFAATTLDVLEGADERAAMERFLAAASQGLRHRNATLAIVRTCGAHRSDGPAGASADATGGSEGGPELGLRARPLGMRAGVTDVGLLALAVLPR